jgi:hypothetical protein
MLITNPWQPPAEIIRHLVQHGCPDITSALDLSSCTEYPIATGGCSDVYQGRLTNGPRVAIKCMRIIDPSDEVQKQGKHLKVRMIESVSSAS